MRPPAPHGVPRTSRNASFPELTTGQFCSHHNATQVDRHLPLALLRPSGTVPAVRSDACLTPPTPPQLKSQVPAAGSAPSLPRSIRRGAARAPRRPDGQDGAAQTGMPPEYGGAFLPANQTRPKSSTMRFTFSQLTTFGRTSVLFGRLGAHMPTCLHAADLSRLLVYMPYRSRVELPALRTSTCLQYHMWTLRRLHLATCMHVGTATFLLLDM